jgi:TP901 family phage tail tape measure protein
MSFDAGAVTGSAVLETAKWMSGIKLIEKTSKAVGGILKKGLAAGFAAVTAGMTASIIQANAYQKEFSNVSTLTDQNTEALQDMSLGLLSLDANLGTTRELTRSMYDAISAGAAPGQEALETVASSAKFAKAAVADNAASVKLLSAATNAYGRENLASDKAADIFFTTIKQGVVTGEELAGTIGQSIPLFSSMNIPLEQLGAGMAAMTKQGVSASESTTQLNAIVSSFLKPSEALTEELEKQGFASGEAFIKQEGLVGAMDLLTTATKTGGKEMATLLPNIRAMRGAMALSDQGAVEFKDTMEAMADNSGVVDEAFKKQEKTMATFKAELGKTSIIVGNIGKFFLDDIVNGAQQALKAVNEFLTSGEGLLLFARIGEIVGGTFSTIEAVFTTLGDLLEDTFMETVDDVKNTFMELFAEVGPGIDVFEILGKAVDFIGGGFNILIRVMGLYLKTHIRLVKAVTQSLPVFSDLWDVITGKKRIADLKESLDLIGKNFTEFGKDFVDDVGIVVTEAQEQWAKLGSGAEDNSKTFSEAWKKGSKDARSFVIKNFRAAISGVKDESGILEKIRKDNEDNNKGGQDRITATTKLEIDKRKALWQGWTTFVEENLKTTLDKVMFWGQTIGGIFSQTFNNIEGLSQQSFENQQTTLDLSSAEQTKTVQDAFNARQAALQANLDAGLISQDAFNKQSATNKKTFEAEKSKIDQEAATKNNELAKKQFEAEKKFSAGQIWMKFAQAAAGYWAWGAPKGPPGWAIAGVQTGLALGNAIAGTALVARQKFVPAFAGGTKNAPGGLAVVGEEGPEAVEIPKGSRVFPASLTSGILDSIGKSKDVTINFHGAVVREEQDLPKIARAVSGILGRELRTA